MIASVQTTLKELLRTSWINNVLSMVKVPTAHDASCWTKIGRIETEMPSQCGGNIMVVTTGRAGWGQTAVETHSVFSGRIMQ
jgi:hypothetical protein